MKTLEEAKSECRMGWEKGLNCPCCTQYVKLWKHSINSAIAMLLIYMYHTKREWVHIMKETKFTTMYGIAQFWGVIIQKTKTPEDDKRASGFWKLTDLGVDFVTGKISIPRYLYLYNDKVIRISEEKCTIKSCLTKKFSYSELMGYDFDESSVPYQPTQTELF
jgi:hypothetical protein